MDRCLTVWLPSTNHERTMWASPASETLHSCLSAARHADRERNSVKAAAHVDNNAHAWCWRLDSPPPTPTNSTATTVNQRGEKHVPVVREFTDIVRIVRTLTDHRSPPRRTTTWKHFVFVNRQDAQCIGYQHLCRRRSGFCLRIYKKNSLLWITVLQ